MRVGERTKVAGKRRSLVFQAKKVSKSSCNECKTVILVSSLPVFCIHNSFREEYKVTVCLNERRTSKRTNEWMKKDNNYVTCYLLLLLQLKTCNYICIILFFRVEVMHNNILLRSFLLKMEANSNTLRFRISCWFIVNYAMIVYVTLRHHSCLMTVTALL